MVVTLHEISVTEPSIDTWFAEAAIAEEADKCGMYLTHHGVVRRSAKATVRAGATDIPNVANLTIDWDAVEVKAAIDQAATYPGVYYVRVWINRGTLNVGDTMMNVMVGADIRPNCIKALEDLVEKLKSEVVSEIEYYEDLEQPEQTCNNSKLEEKTHKPSDSSEK